jgi:PAS domain-containing protein
MVNDRLAKAIGQLQLANQSLRVSRQELCWLDQQLEIMNQEVEVLRREVVRLRVGYSHALDYVPYAALMADEDGTIEAWNAAAQQLFDLAALGSAGIDLSEVPVQPSLRKTLSRKHRAAVERGHPLILKDQEIQVGRTIHRMDVQFTSQGLVIFISSAVGLSAAS